MKIIYFHTHNITQVQTLIGKFLFRNGKPFFIALNMVNHSEKLQGITMFPMKQYDVFCVLLESCKRGESLFTTIRRPHCGHDEPENCPTRFPPPEFSSKQRLASFSSSKWHLQAKCGGVWRPCLRCMPAPPAITTLRLIERTVPTTDGPYTATLPGTL
jgi:hypothetical protein